MIYFSISSHAVHEYDILHDVLHDVLHVLHHVLCITFLLKEVKVQL